jgi:hypothetical protein
MLDSDKKLLDLSESPDLPQGDWFLLPDDNEPTARKLCHRITKAELPQNDCYGEPIKEGDTFWFGTMIPQDVAELIIFYRIALPQALRRIEALRQKAATLTARIKMIEQTLEYHSVWTLAAVHGAPYSGPTYEHELNDLIDALAADEAAAAKMVRK